MIFTIMRTLRSPLEQLLEVEISQPMEGLEQVQPAMVPLPLLRGTLHRPVVPCLAPVDHQHGLPHQELEAECPRPQVPPARLHVQAVAALQVAVVIPLVSCLTMSCIRGRHDGRAQTRTRTSRRSICSRVHCDARKLFAGGRRWLKTQSVHFCMSPWNRQALSISGVGTDLHWCAWGPRGAPRNCAAQQGTPNRML